MPAMSAEERAARMEKLVAALPAEQWGQKPEEVTRAAEAGVAAATVPPLETTGDAGSSVSQKPVREPKLTKNEYEGASDLEDDSDGDEDEAMMPEGEEGLGGSDVEGEEGPSVVNEEDVLDLGEEMDEFLKFATETLGLSESQYEKILQERRDRGGEFFSFSSRFSFRMRRRDSTVADSERAPVGSFRPWTGQGKEGQRHAVSIFFQRGQLKGKEEGALYDGRAVPRGSDRSREPASAARTTPEPKLDRL